VPSKRLQNVRERCGVQTETVAKLTGLNRTLVIHCSLNWLTLHHSGSAHALLSHLHAQ